MTLSFDDYAYNDPYARCLAAKDSAGVEWLKESYASRAAAELSRGREEAKRLYGHDIGHVMLLHVGAFQMVMLPKLMELLRDGGFDLVTLPEAQADPAYSGSRVGRADEGWLDAPGPDASGARPDSPARRRHVREVVRALQIVTESTP